MNELNELRRTLLKGGCAAGLVAFAAATGLISLESVGRAIREKFPAKVAEANILAAADAFKHVRHESGAPHAQAD